MGRFRALLVGVAEYDDQRVQPLPFVTDGLGGVGAALESRGYVLGTDGRAGSGRVTRIEMLTQVQRFLEGAGRGDTLLVFLSGHGAHSDDVDYVVPSDANLAWPKLADVCVPLNAWASLVENTPASGVVFLVDACREGFDEQVMGGLGRAGWSRGKGLDVANRNVAYIFACSPGARSRYVSGDEEFSLFARAVQQIAADPEGPSTLTEFRTALEQVIGELALAHDKPVQQVRILTECDQDKFVVLPPGRRAADRGAWRQLAADHAAWECAGKPDRYSAIRALTDGLVEHLTVVRREASGAAAEDPWQDRGLARRISGHVAFLLTLLGRPELSPAEAALLVATPMVYETQLATQVAQLRAVSPADLAVRPNAGADRASFERFAQGYPRLLRRAAAKTDLSAESALQIGWWLFHRWLVRRPESYASAGLESLLAPGLSESRLAAEVFTGSRMSELMRCVGADPGFLLRTDRPGALRNKQAVAPGTAAEQMVRERLVGYLLATAHYLAIEAIRLPEIIADHLGIADPVFPAALHSTIEAVRWEPRGNSRVLNAPCSHPAVEVALRRHVRDLDALLGDAHDLAAEEKDLDLLNAMPFHATAELVGPAPSPDGPAYTSAGVRFRLAEDRIQDLLMGEQLYGERALAIRELYQNALDACRYRQARAEYLRRTNGPPQDWRGRISFEQGVDNDGRPYLDCIDNGIGMGIRELADVFAQAGTRFADLPEFLEEQTEWSRLDPPIVMHPNSRFGIGVLSYFMLADEITITTCRLGRDGRPTRLLQVAIAGPGNLFRIRDLGAGAHAGTTVRLYLRPDQGAPSCTELLRDILWVAQFDTSAQNGTDACTWPAGELSPYAQFAKIFHASGAPVWWGKGNGRVLTDGIRSDQEVFGAVVNLAGELTPTLSVNRRTILDYRPADVERLLMDAVPALVLSDTSPASPWISFIWLCSLYEDMPSAADLIAQSAIDTGQTWKIGDTTLDAGLAGCCPLDVFFLRGEPPMRTPTRRTVRFALDYNRPGYSYLAIPGRLAAWRLTAYGLPQGPHRTTAEPPRPVVPALPSDIVLMAPKIGLEYTDAAWLDPAEPVSLGQVALAAARLGRSPSQVACRLSALGFTTPDVSNLTADDFALISPNLWAPGDREQYGYWSTLDPAEPVSLRHVIRAAAELGRSPGQVAGRLSALGFTTPDVSSLPGDITRDDVTLISRNLRQEDRPYGSEAWLDPAEPVSLSHVIWAAARLGRSAVQVAERLSALGFTTPDVSGLPGDITRDDLALVSRNRMAFGYQYLDLAEPVSLSHVIRAAAELERSPGQVAGRLSALGFTTPDVSGLPGDITRDDLTLISQNLRSEVWLPGGEAPWLDPAELVSLSHVIRAAAELERSPGQVAGRLSALGFTTPDVSGLPGDITRDDLTLISQNLTTPDTQEIYPPSWLDPAELVSLSHVIRAAAKLERSPGQVAGRLSALGFTTPDVSGLPGDITRDDLTLISRNLRQEDQRFGFQARLDPAEPVSLSHVIRAAAELGRSPGQVAGRLSALGFTTPDVSSLPGDITRDDVTLISRNLRQEDQPFGLEAWLDPAEPVSLSHVIWAAARLGRSAVQVAERLSALGFTTPDVSGLPGDITRDDLALVSRNRMAFGYQYLDLAEPVSLSHVIRAAAELERSPGQVAGRLSALGFTTPDVSGLPGDITRDDLMLISQNLTPSDRGESSNYQWLDPAKPVPFSHVVLAAVKLGRSAGDIADRLSTLGYRPADLALLPSGRPGG